MPNIPRLTQPRKWRGLALAGAAVTLAAPALAGLDAPITLGRAPDARLWLAQSQGGEGGEAGLVASAANPDALDAPAAIEQHPRTPSLPSA